MGLSIFCTLSVLLLSLPWAALSAPDHAERGILATKTIPALSLEKKDTNAKRFAEGLPPLQAAGVPVNRHKIRRHPGFKMSPRQTGGGTTEVCGIISGYSPSEGMFYTYISNTLDDFNRLGWTSYSDQALQVCASTITGDITLTNFAQGGEYSTLAAVIPTTEGFWEVGGPGTLQPGSPAFVSFTASEPVPAGSPPTEVPNVYAAGAKMETAIWTLNPQTFELSAKWINPNGMPVAAYGYFGLDPLDLTSTEDVIGLTGDFNALNQFYTGVFLEWILIPM